MTRTRAIVRKFLSAARSVFDNGRSDVIVVVVVHVCGYDRARALAVWRSARHNACFTFLDPGGAGPDSRGGVEFTVVPAAPEDSEMRSINSGIVIGVVTLVTVGVLAQETSRPTLAGRLADEPGSEYRAGQR